MPLTVNNNKYIKIYKHKNAVQNRLTKFANGFFCKIISLDYTKIEYKHIELIRRFFNKRLKRKGTIVCIVSLTRSLTKKPLQSRMGKGYGKQSSWYTYVSPGKVLFEIKFKDMQLLRQLQSYLYLINKKLTFRCFLVYNNYFFKLIGNFPFFNNLIVLKIRDN